MVTKCDVCGCGQDEAWMVRFFTGHRTKYLCWSCYKQGQKEVSLFECTNHKKLAKAVNDKKVNK